MRLRFLPIARREMLKEAKWHERKRRGDGDRLLVEIGQCLISLREFPHAGHPLPGGYRRKLLDRFPYSLVYVADGEELVVVALANYKRKVGYWRRRLQPTGS